MWFGGVRIEGRGGGLRGRPSRVGRGSRSPWGNWREWRLPRPRKLRGAPAPVGSSPLIRTARLGCLWGPHATPPGQKGPSEPGAPHLGPVVSAEALRDQFGCMPAQPDGSTHVWGVNWFVRLPVHGGEFSADVAQAAGYRMPSAQNLRASSTTIRRFRYLRSPRYVPKGSRVRPEEGPPGPA